MSKNRILEISEKTLNGASIEELLLVLTIKRISFTSQLSTASNQQVLNKISLMGELISEFTPNELAYIGDSVLDE